MNKLKIFLIPLVILCGIILFNQKAKASTQEYFSFEYHDGIFYTHTGGGFFFNDKFATYTMDGKTVYCIEPYANLGAHNYIGDEGFINSPFSDEINKKIELIGHYGYDYPGHQTLKYRMATQALIWETIDGHKVTFYTEAFGYGDVISVDYERNQIMSLVNSHFTKPSFQANTFNATLNTPLELVDEMGVLSSYQVYDNGGNNVSINGNKMTVVPTSIGNSDVILIKPRYDDATTFIYKSETGNYQKLGFFRSSDPAISYISLNVVGGKIKIKKVDSDTNLTIPQGEASLVGAKYQILDDNNNVIETLTIGSDNTATSDYLSPGIYKIKEISSSIGYLIDNNIYTIEINSSDIKEVVVKEQVIKGRVKILKQDSQTNSCVAQGQATLEGAKYEVLNWNNEVVDTLTIGSDCTATSKYLPYGKYKIKEKTSSSGYLIDNNIYEVNVNSNDVVLNVTSKESIIKGRIKILKQDSETNSCTAQYESTLKNATYEVLNWNNEVVDTLTIGDDCTATSKLLPYGKYKIKEKTSSIGYLIDSSVYDVNINSSDIIINVTSKENVIKGRVKILKLDSETNSCVAQGQALLLNAEYQLLDKNNNVVDTLTIGDDCTATSKYVPYGHYKIKESKAGVGYLLDSTIFDVNINTHDIVINVTSKEQAMKGKIRLTKLDSETNSCVAQGEASLVGAKYQVFDKDNNLVDTLTIGEDCIATSKSLPYGVYTIKEQTASVGYNIDVNSYNIDIKLDNSIIDIISKEDVKKTRIKVTKLDSETNSCVAQGQATLFNAKYNVLDKDNNVVDTLTIGDDCTATSKLLPYGHYKIKEIESSIGYEIDNNIYNINITEHNQKIEVTSYEKVIKNFISILKQFDYVDGQTTFLNAEKDVVFEIFYPDGTKYGEVKTDKNGYATLDIPYGVWKFHQVNSNIGFEKIYDFYITIDENSEKEQYYNILNNKLSSYLQVFKIDEETGNTIALANTTFKILNTDTNQYVSQYVGGKVYSNFKTDEDGKFITYLKLEAGNYKLVEISSPKNYLINDLGLEFTIGDETHYAYTTYGPIVTIRFSDKAVKGQVEVHKKGEIFSVQDATFNYDSNVDIENVVFNIYANEDIKSADGNYLYYEKDKLVDTIITDEFGYAISKKLPLGKYYIVEIETNDEYILDSTKYEFELSQLDNRTEIVYKSYDMLNILKKGSLEFTKTDLTTGDVIPNTLIEIYTENDELIFNGYTGEDGKITIDNLKLGRYYILEKEASTGYVITDEKVYFEILEDGEIVKAEMKNKPITSTLEFTKLDISDDKPLPNTLMEVYTENDELIYSGYTDEFGKIVIEDLRYGKYYLLEKKAPIGYLLNDEKMYFEVKEDGAIIKSSLKDERVVGTLKIHKKGETYTIDESCDDKTCFIYEMNSNLANIHFGLYANEDIILNNIKRYSKGDLVADGYTDEDGNIAFDNLYLGMYVVKELDTLDSYILDTDEYEISLEYIDDKTPIIEYNLELKNYLKKSDFEFTKLDISNDKPLPNTLMEVYTENDELIFSGYTDEFGKIIIRNMPIGKYYFVEVEAPEGYILNDEKMYFEVKEDCEIIKSSLKDDKIKNKVVFHKVDEDNNPLADVRIGIYDLDNNLIYDYKTDADGIIEIELEYGKYYYKEISTIDGFVIDENKVFFDVLDNDEIQEFTLVNLRTKVDVPDTEKNFNPLYDILCCTLIFIGIGIIVYVSKENKK